MRKSNALSEPFGDLTSSWNVVPFSSWPRRKPESFDLLSKETGRVAFISSIEAWFRGKECETWDNKHSSCEVKRFCPWTWNETPHPMFRTCTVMTWSVSVAGDRNVSILTVLRQKEMTERCLRFAYLRVMVGSGRLALLIARATLFSWADVSQRTAAFLTSTGYILSSWLR